MCSKNNDDFPFDIEDVTTNLNSELLKHFKGEWDGFVRVGPKGYLFAREYKKVAREIFNMPLRESDVFVVGLPRSGTTWTQELVWLIASDLDYETARSRNLIERSYDAFFLYILQHEGMQKDLRQKNLNNESSLKMLDKFINMHPTNMPSPRFIRFHMPMSLLPPKVLDTAKVVYVARDPRDVVVSGYFLSKLFYNMQFTGNLKQYWELFFNDRVKYTPYFEHIKEAWEMRHHPNMLFIFYEEMRKDLPGTVRRVSRFFNKQYTEEQVEQLCLHLSFENIKDNKRVNGDLFRELNLVLPAEDHFIRKGKVGGWREHFDEEMCAQATEWLARNLRGTDLRFPTVDSDTI